MAKIRCVVLVFACCATAHAWQEVPAAGAPAPTAQSSPTPAVAQAPPVRLETAAEAQVAQLPPTNDPKEIVRRSIEIDRRTLELARNYTCQHREVLK
ncbi:MAG: hypothetical protein ACHP79_14395, partial [Terriglobales bacterium]